MTMQDEFSNIFSNLPQELQEKLEEHFREIIVNFKESKWAPSELDAAKFSEVVFRILEWHTTNGNYTPFGNSIRPFEDKLRTFENKSNFPDSIRFHIPKMLASIYSIRNKRGVGHIGGDVNPNHMDSTVIVYVSKWIMAELVRIFHNLPPSEAHQIIEGIIEKEIPIIWKIGDKKRILNTKLNNEEKTLVLLHPEYPRGVNRNDLCKWVEYSNPTTYKNILDKLHKNKFVEYDKKSSLVTLSPKGVRFVEQNIDLTL